MIPIIFKDPIYNNTFKNMIVGYNKWLLCTNCDNPIVDLEINQPIPKTCPNCRKRIQLTEQLKFEML